jgi:signal transduction histidine kinase
VTFLKVQNAPDESPPELGRSDLYLAYWDACLDGLFAVAVTADGRFLCAGLNPALEAASGLDSRVTRGREAYEYLDAEAAGDLVAMYRECLRAGGPITRTQGLMLPTGIRVCDVSLIPVRGAGGRIELLLGRVQNIGDVVPAGAAAPSAQGLLRDVLDSLRGHVAVLDRKGRVLLVNEAWRRWGRERGVLHAEAGADYIDACAQAAEAGDADAKAALGPLEMVRDGRRRSLAHVYRSGESVFQMRAARMERGSELWILVTHDDVTAAHEAQRELSDLTERMLDIQEEERRRIALELHDSTSQHLVAVQLGLTVLSQGRATDQTLADMRDELMEAHREIRTLSYLLHPPRLADERLSSTLRKFVEGFQRRTGAAVDLKLEGPLDETPHRVQRAVFRVLQEAMANAHKHASAKLISVRVTRDAEGLSLEVADDGRNPQLLIVPGVGIPGMEARVERFGGALKVTPSSRGTTVAAFIPAEALDVPAEPERQPADTE